MHHEYELTLIARPDIDEPATYAAFDKVEATVSENGGHVLERDDWGKRRLAYPIKKHSKGHYALLRLLSEPEAILEIERKIRLDDRIIRFLSVRLSEGVDVQYMIEQAEVARKAAEAEAAAKAAAAEAAAAEAGAPDTEGTPAESKPSNDNDSGAEASA